VWPFFYPLEIPPTQSHRQPVNSQAKYCANDYKFLMLKRSIEPNSGMVLKSSQCQYLQYFSATLAFHINYGNGFFVMNQSFYDTACEEAITNCPTQAVHSP
jgi:hypothetical protein